jgi:hypothetical protein
MPVGFKDADASCCEHHNCEAPLLHYSIAQVIIVDVNPVLPKSDAFTEVMLLVRDDRWRGEHYLKHHIIAYDIQFDMFVLACGALVEYEERTPYFTFVEDSLSAPYCLLEQTVETRTARFSGYNEYDDDFFGISSEFVG